MGYIMNFLLDNKSAFQRAKMNKIIDLTKEKNNLFDK
jgi:hypothetical protein